MKKLILANPRGFCAGVERAIHIVERALEKYGSPIYVRHEIVHNQFVVDSLKARGVIFVEELAEVPEGALVIFSAHGVGQSIYEDAKTRKLRTLDATCPLVQKVHSSAKKHYAAGRHIIMIGHVGHAEVEGTLGQLPQGAIDIVRNRADVENLVVPFDRELAYITQTTLSVDEAKDTIAALHERFPNILGPIAGDLCYATGNRQAAVRELCSMVDFLVVVGSSNSSNSTRLCELGSKCGIESRLVSSVKDLDFSWFNGVETVGLSSGASAPDELVRGVVDALCARFVGLEIENSVTMVENLHFNLPPELQE